MHNDAITSDEAHKKPEMILFYNKTKAGVDSMDQKCSRYTTQRRTCRWPLAFFYNILDISTLAAYIVYYENNKMIRKKTNERRIFMRELAEQSAMPAIEERSCNQQIMRHYSTKLAIQSYFDTPIGVVQGTTDNQPRDKTGRKIVLGSCFICNKQPNQKRRETRKCCIDCEKPVCDEHSKKITKCMKCYEEA